MKNKYLIELENLLKKVFLLYKKYRDTRDSLYNNLKEIQEILKVLRPRNECDLAIKDEIKDIKFFDDKYKNELQSIINNTKESIKTFEYFSNEHKKIIEEINNCRFEFNFEEIEMLSVLLNKIKFNYKNNLLMNKITKEDYNLIDRLFKMGSIPRTNQIKMIETLRIHNTIIDYKLKNEQLDYKQLYKTLDALDLGSIIKKNINISSDRRKIVDNYINSFKMQMKYDSNYNFIGYLLIYFEMDKGVFSSNLSKEEVEYFYENILDYINDLIYSNKKLLMEYDEKNPSSFDTNFYLNNSTKKEIIDNIYKLIKIYKYIFKTYEDNIYLYDEYIKSKDNSTKNDLKINDVYYMSLPSYDENQKTYVEKDLKSVPNDLYGLIKYYLELLSTADVYEKERTNPKFEGTEVLGGVHKIKDDQLRIIYEHLGENKIGVKGIFIKKKDFGRDLYVNVANRCEKYVSSEEVEQKIFDYLDENKHKGGRVSL